MLNQACRALPDCSEHYTYTAYPIRFAHAFASLVMLSECVRGATSDRVVLPRSDASSILQ